MWREATVDMTILKEIYYSTCLPNNISCTGNDITVGCGAAGLQFPRYSPHWILYCYWKESCSVSIITTMCYHDNTTVWWIHIDDRFNMNRKYLCLSLF